MSQSSNGTTLTPAEISAAGQNVTSNLIFFNGGGVTAPPSTGSSSNPYISQDQSGFSQWTLQTIQNNPLVAGDIPGLEGATTVGQALQDFMDMSPAQLQYLQMQLYDAGFYTNADGSPMSAADINFGSPGDPASWTAFTRALGEASQSHVSLSVTLQGRTQAGAGANNLLPSPATGGGNVYTIDLSNPTSVKYTADQIFQSALGRNATDSEVQDITNKLRSQETQQGLTQEQGKEQQSQAAYQANVNQRNIAYENQTNPNLTGQIPTGPFANPESWATALLSYMNMPVTTSNVAAITAWAKKIGKFNDGSFNPLDTSRPEGGSSTAPDGSQQFQNWAQGLRATASMLMDGKYSALTTALQNGTATQAVSTDPAVKQELNTWSAGRYSSLTVDSNTTSQAAQATWYWNANNKSSNVNQSAVQATLHAGATNPAVGAYLQSQQQAVQNTLQAGATNPAVGAYLTAQAQAAGSSTVNPANVSQGQQPPNPGDTYINPVTVYDVAPADASSQAYQEATTGANRIPYAANNYLNAYQAVLSMIHSGGPTAG